MTAEELRARLDGMNQDELRVVLAALRQDHGLVLHPLERKWKTTAEAILEAIDQSNDLTQRGIRGILAEATFKTEVIPKWAPRWEALPVAGDAYDALVRDQVGSIRIQVKLQRREKQQPMLFSGRGITKDPRVYTVETQRTRNGVRTDEGAAADVPTRPYRVDEFDVLAVCIQPLTEDWTDFRYCATRDLLVRPGQPHLLAVKQPVYLEGSDAWSADFSSIVERLRTHVVP